MPDVSRRALTLVVTAALAALLWPTWPARATEPTRTTETFFWANAWAAHHTAARGGAASGAERMRRLVRLVRESGVGLGALAEIERSQVAAFRRSAPTYTLFTGGHGNTEGVFWETDRFDLVDSYRFRSFSYGGRRVPVPVAVLRERASQQLVAVVAVHNPRDHWRDRALRRELEEVRRLRRSYPDGISVLVAGDFNAGESVACRAHRLKLFSVGDRDCRGYAPIDQLLTDWRTRVRSYRRLAGSRVHRITDHPAVYRARLALAPPP